ncbi:MAG TPA: glycoside hydrolase family 3 N-terminal domain-containing protein [Planctomycetota bacterium]|nr:glycoside hydrolase family 3 N-terminal domain-containing protein [Planctomycetota bacterium]
MTAQQHVARMTLREKCAQMVFFEHRFGEDDPERTSHLVRKDGAGGLLMVGGSKFDLPSFVNWAQKVAKVPVLVVGDYEDGAGPQVAGATAYPSAAAIASTGSPEFAQTKGRHIGLEARALGARMVLGPAASDPLARPSMDGFHYSKMAVCLKGFPGPGVEELAADADGILAGPGIAAEVDDEQPACLSRAVIQGTLRREYRFEGLVFMNAFASLGSGPGIFERAANAGVDVFLSPPDPAAAMDLLEAGAREGRIAEATIDRAATRLLLRKERLGLFADRMVEVVHVEQVVGAPAHAAAALRMAQAAGPPPG